MKTLKLTLASTFRKHYALFYLTLFSIILLCVRIKITHSFSYLFMVWNLFLAYLPLAITILMVNNVKLIERKVLYYPLLFSWLLLLPNAPYIITDFIHLKIETSVPVWFDILLLISFTSGGILAGLASMKHMFSIISIKTNPLAAWLITAITCMLTGFGIYVGRYLRYNSWDIISNPGELFADILHNIAGSTPFGITLGFGGFLFLLFHLYYKAEV